MIGAALLDHLFLSFNNNILLVASVLFCVLFFTALRFVQQPVNVFVPYRDDDQYAGHFMLTLSIGSKISLSLKNHGTKGGS